jgi:hypothetical protein
VLDDNELSSAVIGPTLLLIAFTPPLQPTCKELYTALDSYNGLAITWLIALVMLTM